MEIKQNKNQLDIIKIIVIIIPIKDQFSVDMVRNFVSPFIF